MSGPRVVVTGWGAVTPLGTTAEESWRRLAAGGDGRVPVTLFDVTGCRCREAAQAALPECGWEAAPRAGRWSRATRLAVPAMGEALAMAGLLGEDGKCREAELPLVASTTGGAMAGGEKFLRGVLAGRRRGLLGAIARYQPQQQVLDAQTAWGLRGPAVIIANACASGANALGHAWDLLRTGRAECVLAGGYEALSELIFYGFDCLQAVSPGPCRPFDRRRDGLMMGEAAAFCVLETAARARARGAEPLGVLCGYGHSTDRHHLTQPSPDGAALAQAMRQAAERAGVRPGQIGYVNAHGTGTPMNDGAEAASFRSFFGDWPAGLRMSSSKAAIGHTLGAAGAVEAVLTWQALRDGVLPPQLHTEDPLPEVAELLPGVGERWGGGRMAVSVNLGFGGSNAALVLSAP